MHTAIHSPVTGTVILEGELTWVTVPVVRHALLTAVTKPHARHLIVDLGGVTFLDCAGAGALVFGRNAAAALDLPFGITNAVGSPRHVLGLLNLLGPLSYPGGVSRSTGHGDPGEPPDTPSPPSPPVRPRVPRMRRGDPGEPG